MTEQQGHLGPTTVVEKKSSYLEILFKTGETNSMSLVGCIERLRILGDKLLGPEPQPDSNEKEPTPTGAIDKLQVLCNHQRDLLIRIGHEIDRLETLA